MFTCTYDISREREHYVVTINGKFYCTADTYSEAMTDIQKFMDDENLKIELDWIDAVENAKENDILMKRYNDGDRSQELYDAMMSIEN